MFAVFHGVKVRSDCTSSMLILRQSGTGLEATQSAKLKPDVASRLGGARKSNEDAAAPSMALTMT